MKKHILVCLLTGLLSSTYIFSQAKSLQARFAYCTFFAPGSGPYVETYLNISGTSASYVPVQNGAYQAAIEVSILYQEDGKIKYFDKYNLLSPETKDTINSLYNFTDQKRVSLPNGNYQLLITIRDKNNLSSKANELRQDVSLNYLPNVIAISDIELLNSYKKSDIEGPLFKNGYDLEPANNNFYSKDNGNLKFYAEIYNTNAILDKDPFLLTYHLETFEQKKILNNFSGASRQVSKPVTILLNELDITELPSGNYNLVIEARNKNNELLAVKELFFQRSKPIQYSESGDISGVKIANTFAGQITSKDTLKDYILCLYPISTPKENAFAMNQLDAADMYVMQQFFYDFWQKRNPVNPQMAWNEYKIQVDKVNAEYKAINKKGYQTDRGRVYLQYGPPNQISQSYSEPTSYPYEIWQYYKTQTETNRKFVFASLEMASNDFKLLHSDAKGEIFERQWQLLLKKRNSLSNDLDMNKPKDNNSFGSQSDQIFNNPR